MRENLAVQLAPVFAFNDFESYLSEIVLASLYLLFQPLGCLGSILQNHCNC